MTWYAILAWIAGVWVAIGLEALSGGGLPGIALMVALAAGLWAGPFAGAVLGALAGLCDAALGGHHLLWLLTIGSLAGAGAGLLPRWVSRRHLLVGMATAAVFTVLIALALAAADGALSPVMALQFARRASENALWMIPIYGIVLVFSSPRITSHSRGKY